MSRPSRINRVIELTQRCYKQMLDEIVSAEKRIGDDVRLCIDFGASGEPRYILRFGDVQYDPYHSELCGAESFGGSYSPIDTLESLINQCLDQCAETEETES